MKKILILVFSVTLLVSCGINIDNNKNIKRDIIEKDENSTEKEEDKNIFSNEKKVSFEEVRNNLEKLKNLSPEKIKELNFIIKNFYNRYIIEEAKKYGDLNICNKLEKIEQENCKEVIILSKKDENLCSILSNIGAIKNCKNRVFTRKAQDNLDEKICEKIEDNSKEKYKISNCKNKVFYDKAVKNLDSNICKKISDKNEIQMCSKIVEIERKNKKILEE